MADPAGHLAILKEAYETFLAVGNEPCTADESRDRLAAVSASLQQRGLHG
jgi:hypothetical protein